jgi:hypothetical protein
MFKPINGAMLAFLLAGPAFAASVSVSSPSHTARTHCIRLGFDADSPSFRQCLRRAQSSPYGRGSTAMLRPPAPISAAAEPVRDADHSAGLTESQLSQERAGPVRPDVTGPDVIVQSHRDQGFAGYKARQAALIARRAEAQRQRQVDQSMETIRPAAAP